MSTFHQAKAYARRAAKDTGIAAVVEELPGKFISVSTELRINSILHSNRDCVKLIITAKVIEHDDNEFVYSYTYEFKEYNVDTQQNKPIEYPYELKDLMDNL